MGWGIFLSQAPQRYCRVKATGQRGKVLLHDPDDATLAWKLQLKDRSDWFKAVEVVETSGSEACYMTEARLYRWMKLHKMTQSIFG